MPTEKGKVRRNRRHLNELRNDNSTQNEEPKDEMQQNKRLEEPKPENSEDTAKTLQDQNVKTTRRSRAVKPPNRYLENL